MVFRFIHHFPTFRRITWIISFIIVYNIILIQMIYYSRRLLLSHQLIASATATFLPPSNSLSSSFVIGKQIIDTTTAMSSSVRNESCRNTSNATSCFNNNNNSNNNHEDIMKLIHPIGLGTYLMKREEIPIVLKNAIEVAGYRRIDCAPVYFNEDIIGDTIHSIINDGIISRNELFIVSKLPSPFHSNPELAIQKILNDLRLDYLDLFLIHWPVAFQSITIDPNKRGYDNEDIDDSNNGHNIDTTISIHDTWKLMEELVYKGYVKYIGVSNFPIILLHELLSKATIKPLLNQCECHPYLQQNKLRKYCEKRGIHFQAYNPLGSSIESRTIDDPIVLNDPVIQQIASKYNVSTALICLQWSIQIGNSIVVKSSNKQNQMNNMNVVQSSSSFTLTDDDMKLIETLDRNYRYFRPEEWWEDMPVAVFH